MYKPFRPDHDVNGCGSERRRAGHQSLLGVWPSQQEVSIHQHIAHIKGPQTKTDNLYVVKALIHYQALLYNNAVSLTSDPHI